MASKKFLIPILFLVFCSKVEGASLLERSYEYVINLGKNIAPSFMSILDCMGENEVWSCAKEKAGKILDGWNDDVEKERRSWREAADAEVRSSGRSLEEMPSKVGEDVENTLASFAEILHHGMARALSSQTKHESGGIDSITISTSGDKKKPKKKKQKPAAIHLIQVPMRKVHKPEKGRSFPNGRQTWVIGDTSDFDQSVVSRDALREGAAGDVSSGVAGENRDVFRQGRGVMSDLWSMGEKAVDAVAEHALEAEEKDNGVEDKSSIAEQRGKKKKKKKAILKLLILGAVLKAKIGTILQILSFKLQVKFFIIALLGLAINLARLWIDIKNKHNHQPQKVIYYEHAQHQHHYDHEEEPEHGWGPWSRSMEPEEADVEVDVDLHNSPYRAQERNSPYFRPPGNVKMINV